MNAILKVSNLTKCYGKRTVLDNVSFELGAGESIALVGRSGCGKSTLLNCIGMLEDVTSGNIEYKGQRLPKANSARATKIRRNDISYLFQSFALISSITAMQNVLLGMHYVKKSKNEKRQIATELFRRLGLEHVMDNKVTTLSGGEQQRVSLIRSVLKPGGLILADEPTGSLDGRSAQMVFHEILGLQRDYGKSLLVVTHDMAIAQQCDRVLDLTPVGSQTTHSFGKLEATAFLPPIAATDV